MKRRMFLICLLTGIVMVVGLSGCIISATPDTGKPIMMKQGDSQTFTVKSIGGPVTQYWWNEGDNPIKQSLPTFTYTPPVGVLGQQFIGCIVSEGYFGPPAPGSVCPGPCPLIMFNATRRTYLSWQVYVSGVVIDEGLSSIAPGETTDFKTRVYPEGDYTYEWFLDQKPIGTGATLHFSHDPALIGDHTLSVTATGAQGSFSDSISLQVAFARVGSDLDDEPGHIIQTADGGYVVTATSHDYYSHVQDIKVFRLAPDGSILWHTTLGGGSIDFEGGIVATADGGYIVAGTSYSTDIPGAANHGVCDVYLAKLDAQGAIMWQRLYGGSSEDWVIALAPTSDGGCVAAGSSSSEDIPGVAGHSDGDFYVIKFDTDGALQWQNLYDVEYGDSASSIRQTADRGFIIAGSSRKDYSSTSYIAHVLKLDPEGSLQWSKRYSSSVFYDVLEAPDGGYLAAGMYIGWALIVKYDNKGNQLWGKTYGTDYFSYLLPGSGNDYIAIGYTYSDEIPGNPGDYGYVVKLNVLGIPLLKKRMPAVISPIPIVGGGYMALCLVKQLGTYDYYDISLVKIGPF